MSNRTYGHDGVNQQNPCSAPDEREQLRAAMTKTVRDYDLSERRLHRVWKRLLQLGTLQAKRSGIEIHAVGPGEQTIHSESRVNVIVYEGDRSSADEIIGLAREISPKFYGLYKMRKRRSRELNDNLQKLSDEYELKFPAEHQ